MSVNAEQEHDVCRTQRGPTSPYVTSQSLPVTGGRAPCYLLFAGSHQPRGDGFEDVVGTFTSEETARQAFLDVRLSTSSPMSWAQLAVVDEHQGIKPLCWFGSGATPARTPVTFARPGAAMPRQTQGEAVQVEAPESRPAPETLYTGPKLSPPDRPRLPTGRSFASTRRGTDELDQQAEQGAPDAAEAVRRGDEALVYAKREMEPTMDDHGDRPYLLPLLFIGTIALSAFLWWISDLTAGPGYGGRYDVPAVNGAAWFGFLASIPAVLIVGGLWMARLDKWVDSRRRSRQAGEA